MKTFNLLLTYFLTQLYPVAPHSFNGASSPTTSRRSAVTTWLDISWYDL